MKIWMNHVSSYWLFRTDGDEYFIPDGMELILSHVAKSESIWVMLCENDCRFLRN